MKTRKIQIPVDHDQDSIRNALDALEIELRLMGLGIQAEKTRAINNASSCLISMLEEGLGDG